MNALAHAFITSPVGVLIICSSLAVGAMLGMAIMLGIDWHIRRTRAALMRRRFVAPRVVISFDAHPPCAGTDHSKRKSA